MSEQLSLLDQAPAPMPELQNAASLLALLDAWVEHGWLRALDKWVWARNQSGQLPAGEDGMTCLSVTMTEGRAITIADAAEPVCAIRMTMTYYEEE